MFIRRLDNLLKFNIYGNSHFPFDMKAILPVCMCIFLASCQEESNSPSLINSRAVVDTNRFERSERFQENKIFYELESAMEYNLAHDNIYLFHKPDSVKILPVDDLLEYKYTNADEWSMEWSRSFREKVKTYPDLTKLLKEYQEFEALNRKAGPHLQYHQLQQVQVEILKRAMRSSNDPQQKEAIRLFSRELAAQGYEEFDLLLRASNWLLTNGDASTALKIETDVMRWSQHRQFIVEDKVDRNSMKPGARHIRRLNEKVIAATRAVDSLRGVRTER